MKKNKLYIVNKWNKPAFGNMFAIGGFPLNDDYNKGANFGGIGFPDTSISYNAPAVSTSPNLNSSDLKPLKATPDPKSKPSGGGLGNIGMGTIMGGLSALGDIPTGDKRGMWDTADPLYHLAGGRESGVGNTMSDVGVGLTKAGLSSGQPWLALAGGITKGIGSLINAAFGVKENKENTNFIKQNTQKASSMGNVLAGSSDNMNLVTNAGKMVGGSGFNWGDLYQNGWFTSKGTRLGNNLIAKENTALAIQGHGLATGAGNIDSNMDRNALRNFAAFGGPLGSGMGAIDYGFMSDYLTMRNNQKNTEGVTNPFAGVSPELFAEGGKIHIKPYVLEGKSYYKNGGVLEGDFDVDDLSRDEITELNKLGYTVEIL